MLPRLLNLKRARDLMARDGVDALVAQRPINVYYLSDYWGFLMGAERFDAAYFAVLPRAPESPASDARVSGWLQAHGVAPAAVRYEPSFFNEIRMIKTIPEVVLMRSPALKKERAGDARHGRGARRGCALGRNRDGLRDRDGPPGRKGRVLHLRRRRADRRASASVPRTAETLGGDPADDPRPLGVQLGTRPGQVLEPGMVINVDMPYAGIGWGSLQVEDTVLVTADGHELLTTGDLELRCVPG